MLTIGEFSKICFVTKKTLRHYDEIGLLQPEYIAENGYRYYTVEQLRTMLLITRLKSYGFSLPEIAATLANRDEDLLAQKIAAKRRQMQAQMQNTQQILRQMEQDEEKLKRRMDIMDTQIPVKTIELAPMRIYGVRKTISVGEFPEIFALLFKTIAEKHIRPLGAPMAFYHDPEFDAEHSDIEIAVPVDASVAQSHELPGGLHCYATIVGPYKSESFTAVYAALCKWIDDNGYRMSGAPYDKYVKGGDEGDPEEYITEVYFPIEKNA